MSVGSEHPGYYAGDASFSGKLDVTSHCIDLVVRVDEVAASWPDHHDHRQFRLTNNGGDQSSARSSATIAEVGAQLDTVSTSTLCGERFLERFQCCFYEDETASN